MANRDNALQGISWLLALGVFAGVCVLGYRAWVREAEEIAREKREKEAAEKPAIEAGPARSPAAEALGRCKDAIARSLVVGNWKQTRTVCQEAEQDARGESEMKALLLALRCHEWQVKAGMEQGDEDESERPRDVRLINELQRWIAQDCAPDASLRQLVQPLSAEAACALRLEPLAKKEWGQSLDKLERFRRLPEDCRDSASGKELFAKLKPAAEQEAAIRCEQLAPRHQNEDSAPSRACRVYVELKYCPDVSALMPPAGKTLQLDGKLKAKGWRPSDPLLVSLQRQTPPDEREGWFCTEDGRLGSKLMPRPRPTGPIRPIRK